MENFWLVNFHSLKLEVEKAKKLRRSVTFPRDFLQFLRSTIAEFAFLSEKQFMEIFMSKNIFISLYCPLRLTFSCSLFFPHFFCAGINASDETFRSSEKKLLLMLQRRTWSGFFFVCFSFPAIFISKSLFLFARLYWNPAEKRLRGWLNIHVWQHRDAIIIIFFQLVEKLLQFQRFARWQLAANKFDVFFCSPTRSCSHSQESWRSYAESFHFPKKHSKKKNATPRS